jgi:hypothetical protein
MSHHNPDATAIQAATRGSGRELIEGVLSVPHHFPDRFRKGSRRRLEDYRSRGPANVSAGGATGWNSTGSRHRAAPKILLNLAVSGQLGWKDNRVRLSRS